MFRHTSIFLALAVVCGIALLLTNSARSQLGVAKNYVNLQASTPGTAQSGHSNVSGTSRAAQFVGGGAGLTGVNAAQLGGLAPNQYGVVNNNNSWIGLNTFSQPGNSFTGNGAGLHSLNASNIASGTLNSARLPNPLVVSGNLAGDGVIVGSNSSAAAFSRGVVGVLTAATAHPSASAVWGTVSGPSGIGVLGQHNGNGFGVYGVTADGTAVQGESAFGTALAAGTTTGLGLNISSGGRGIEATSTLRTAWFKKTGTDIGDAVTIESASTNGYALRSVSTGTGDATAIRAETSGANSFSVSASNTGPNGFAVIGQSTGAGSAGVAGSTDNATGTGVLASNFGGGYAARISHKSLFQGNVEIEAGRLVSLGAGTNPLFPLDFPETLGDKISLWGTSPTANYGFGIQAGQLQIFSAGLFESISFGYGGSGAFTERARFTNDAELQFRPDNLDIETRISAPWDVLLFKDRDNDSGDEWFRFLTNGGTVEQLRILQNDEAAALFDGAVTANGIDYAEAFKVYDPSLEPGDLVINAGSNWEYIGRSMTPYDNSVIGVISTKPAFLAGLSFDAEEKIDPALTQRRDEARRKGNEKLEKALTMQMRKKAEEAHRPVAFMGRVPVKVVGPVKVGDHLTSSAIPGVAMAMTQPGHSIGIALESSSGGQAKVMGMIQPRFYAGPVAQGGLASVPELVAMKNRLEKMEAENKAQRTEIDALKSELKELRELVRERSARKQ